MQFKTEANAANVSDQMRVCVIGAGVSGLVVTKELHELGIPVTCYEMMPIISGVFGSHTWNHGRLTSSTANTFFSDFPVENRQHFMEWQEFCDYLERYVDHFGIRDCIQLNCKVTSAQKLGGRWQVYGKSGNFSNGHRFHPIDPEVQSAEFQADFTHLVVCTGLHQQPKIPCIPGLGNFPGRVLHSSKYRDADEFRNQVVVMVGAGESGSDIARQVAPVADQLYLSLRSAPGTLFPRWIQGNTPDIRDDRITYNLPRLYKPVILRGHRHYYQIQRKEPELFKWAKESNFENKRCSFNSAACKSFGIPEAVVNLGAMIKPAIQAIDGNLISFHDGSYLKADVLLFCTGFNASFPFLDESITQRFGRINHLWKNMFDPHGDETLCFIGFARPNQINLLAVAELQARTFATILKGDRTLPSTDEMMSVVKADQAFMQKHYQDRAIANPALVDYAYYTETLAHFIGCNIPWFKVWTQHPKLALKLIYSAMHGAHFRLQGPGTKWDVATQAILATPQFQNRRNAILRWILLTVFTLYARGMSLFNPEFRSMGAIARQQLQDYQGTAQLKSES